MNLVTINISLTLIVKTLLLNKVTIYSKEKNPIIITFIKVINTYSIL